MKYQYVLRFLAEIYTYLETRNETEWHMKLITIQELAELLKVKPKTLYQWAELRQIPFLKLNGALRFDLDDIEKWIASCKKNTGSGYNQITKTVTSSPTKGGN